MHRSIFLHIISILAFLPFIQCINLDPDNVIIAINCGAKKKFVTKDNVVFKPDKDYATTGSSTSDLGFQLSENWDPVEKYFPDIPIYYTERYSMGDFYYNLPFEPIEGTYVLILKFSEVAMTASDAKIFDVGIGDARLERDMDIFARVGQFRPFDLFFEFELRDGTIVVDDLSIPNGYDSTKKTLKVSLFKGAQDNPKINGIVLVKGGLESTPEKEFTAYLSQLDQLMKDHHEKEVDSKLSQYESNFEGDMSNLGNDQPPVKRISKTELKKYQDVTTEYIKSFLSSKWLFELSCILFMGLIFFILSKRDSNGEDEPQGSKGNQNKEESAGIVEMKNLKS